MDQPITSLILMGMTVVSLSAALVAWRNLRQAHPRTPTPVVTLTLAGLVAASASLLVSRWVTAGEFWRPLHAHVDGLLLITLLLAGALLFLRWRPRMLAVSAFGLPVLALLYAWAVCAAAWTYRPFRLDTLTPVWSWLHLTGVYLGTLCFVIGAVAAAAYLYVHRRIKRRDNPEQIGELPSLERLETLLVRTATVGFAVLSIGLAGGIVILTRRPDAIGDDTWTLVKLVLAGGVWMVYALLINLRFGSRFRGPNAARISIAGLVLLIVTYGVVTALPSAKPAAPVEPAAAPTAIQPEEVG